MYDYYSYKIFSVIFNALIILKESVHLVFIIIAHS